MEQVVGYFDVLNMHYAGTNTEARESITTAFVKPIRFVAVKHADLKCEVFPDSLVMGCNPEFLETYIQIVQGLYRNWCANYVLVRGGIAYGEIESISGSFEKRLPSVIDGMKMVRLNGPALADAYRLTENAVPGMLCFLTPVIAEVIKLNVPALVTAENPHSLVWFDSGNAEGYSSIFRMMLERTELHLRKAETHILATIDFLEQYTQDGTK